MGWPQWVWIVLMGLSWLIVLFKHGEQKDGRHDSGVATTVLGIHVFLLWQGGFFS